jgi:hypothetical protein
MRSSFVSFRGNAAARSTGARQLVGRIVGGICLPLVLATGAGALGNPRFPGGGGIGRPGDGGIFDPVPTVLPPPQPTPVPDLARPGLSIVERGTGTMTLSWCDGSRIETGNHLWRTSNPEAPIEGDIAAVDGQIVSDLSASPNGCHDIVDGSIVADPLPPIATAKSLTGILNGMLQPDTLYCYQVVPHDHFSEFADYMSRVVCSYTRERPSRSVWRAQIVLRTANGSSDGTDDAVDVALNRRYLGALYEHLAGFERPYGNVTKLDRPGDDHERGNVEIYDLNLDGIGDMGDITEVSIEKSGDDEWCLDGVALLINDETMFEKTFTPCRRATYEYVLGITHEELRASPAWSAYTANLVPADAGARLLRGETVRILDISRGDLEKRIEGIVGDSISGNSLEWGGLEGGAYVEVTPVDTETVRVDLDLEADVTGSNPKVDLDFDLRFAMACNGSGIDFTVETPPGSFKVKADASWTSYVLSSLFCSGVDGFVGEDCPVAVESAIESQIRNKFTPIANVVRFDLGKAGAACGTVFQPVARITPGGALVIEVRSLLGPPGPTPQPTPKPTPQPTPSPAPTVGVVTSTLRLNDDPTPPIDASLRRLVFRSTPGAAPSDVVAPAFGGVGDPTINGAELFVYRVGGDPDDVARIPLPAARWRRTGDATSPGYKYVDKRTKDGPISKVVVQGGKLTIKGRGEGLYELADAPQGQMAVRVRMGRDVTWCAAALAKPPLASNDSAAKFVGVPDSPPPITCPDVPGVEGSASRAFVDAPASLLE